MFLGLQCQQSRLYVTNSVQYALDRHARAPHDARARAPGAGAPRPARREAGPGKRARPACGKTINGE